MLGLLLPRSVPAGVQCDGIDDLLTTGVALSEFVTPGAFTVMGWIRVLNGAPTSVQCWNGGPMTTDAGGYHALGRTSSTQFCGNMYDAGTGLQMLTTPSSPNWHHLALSLGGGTLTLFLDGVATGSLNPVGNITNVTHHVQLCQSLEGQTLSDIIEDMRYYDVALSVVEIEVLAQSRRRDVGRTLPSVHWTLDGCSDGSSAQGTVFADRSGHGRPAAGNDGANNAGLTCRASEFVTYGWGVD